VSGDTYEWHYRLGAEQRGAEAREAGFGTFEATCVNVAGPGPWPFKVARADPRILVSDLMMDLIRDGCAAGWEISGDVMRFEAVNGTWVYRLGGHLEDRRAWIAEWPD
jgi:hypothetical protein